MRLLHGGEGAGLGAGAGGGWGWGGGHLEVNISFDSLVCERRQAPKLLASH